MESIVPTIHDISRIQHDSTRVSVDILYDLIFMIHQTRKKHIFLVTSAPTKCTAHAELDCGSGVLQLDDDCSARGGAMAAADSTASTAAVESSGTWVKLAGAATGASDKTWDLWDQKSLICHSSYMFNTRFNDKSHGIVYGFTDFIFHHFSYS